MTTILETKQPSTVELLSREMGNIAELRQLLGYIRGVTTRRVDFVDPSVSSTEVWRGDKFRQHCLLGDENLFNAGWPIGLFPMAANLFSYEIVIPQTVAVRSRVFHRLYAVLGIVPSAPALWADANRDFLYYDRHPSVTCWEYQGKILHLAYTTRDSTRFVNVGAGMTRWTGRWCLVGTKLT